MAGIEVDCAFITGQVIDPMRDKLTFASTWKIMAQGFDGGLCLGMPFTGKVTDQSLLFRINADDRITCGKLFRFDAGNVFELCITVRMRTH